MEFPENYSSLYKDSINPSEYSMDMEHIKWKRSQKIVPEIEEPKIPKTPKPHIFENIKKIL